MSNCLCMPHAIRIGTFFQNWVQMNTKLLSNFAIFGSGTIIDLTYMCAEPLRQCPAKMSKQKWWKSWKLSNWLCCAKTYNKSKSRWLIWWAERGRWNFSTNSKLTMLLHVLKMVFLNAVCLNRDWNLLL